MLTSFEHLANWLRARFGDSDRGASLVEYALLLGLIATVCVVSLVFLGGKASDSFETTGSSFAVP